MEVALKALRDIAKAQPDCPEAVEALLLCEDALSTERQQEEDRKQARLDLRAIWGIG